VNLIEPAYLVSDGTSLFEMPELLKQNSFYFVLSANTIIGYVHYSDLNKSIMKIPFFALFQLTESALWEKFKDRITEDNMRIVFGEDQAKRFTAARKEATKSNVDVGWTGVFTFPSILRLARHFGLVHFTDDEIGLLRDVRNNVSHSDKNLVAQHSDVEMLVRAYSMFQQVIERT